MLNALRVAADDQASIRDLVAPESSRKIGAEEAAVRRFICQTKKRPQSKVDRATGETPGLKMHSVPNDNRLVEGEPWPRAVSVHEFVDGVAVPPLRIWARQTAENRGFRNFKIW